MIPKIIHFSVPRRTSGEQDRIIQRARELHPEWDVMIWRDPIDSHGFRLAHYHEKANSGAQLADLIRLDIVYEHGGVYLDSDVLLEKTLLPLMEADNFFCSEDGSSLTNAVFAATKHNDLLDLLIRDLLDNEPDWRVAPNATTGPGFFSRLLRWQKTVNLLPRDSFYPYNWHERPIKPLPTGYGTHLWAGSWHDEGFLRKARNATALAIYRARKAMAGWFKGPRFRRWRQAIADVLLPPEPKSFAYGQDQIAVTSRGLLMSLPGSDLSITPEIALRNTYAEKEISFIERTLKGGDFAVDVGSNVGVFTLVAAVHVGPFGRVWAIDANPEVVVHLERSLVMQGLHDRVHVLQCAAAERAGRAELSFSPLRLGDARLSGGPSEPFDAMVDRLGQRKTLSVETRRLDDLIPHDVEIKLMKIDVAGHEHAVLAGAHRLIGTRSIQHLIVALCDNVGQELYRRNLAAVEEVLAKGYELWAFKDWHTIRRVNSLEAAKFLSRSILLTRSRAAADAASHHAG